MTLKPMELYCLNVSHLVGNELVYFKKITQWFKKRPLRLINKVANDLCEFVMSLKTLEWRQVKRQLPLRKRIGLL
jgi:hypothetical protein